MRNNSRDWEVLKKTYDEDGEAEYERNEVAEEELLAYKGRNPKIHAEFLAYQRFRDLKRLNEHAAEYPAEISHQLMQLFITFGQYDKALVLGNVAARCFPDDQYMLVRTVKAATESDLLLGKIPFFKLTLDIPRSELTPEAYQVAVRYLIKTIKSDESLARELLDDYRTYYPRDQEWYLLSYELEHALGRTGGALKALEDAVQVRKDAYIPAKKLFSLYMELGLLDAAKAIAWYGYHAVNSCEETVMQEDVAFFVLSFLRVEAEKIFVRAEKGEPVPSAEIQSTIDRLKRFESDFPGLANLERRSLHLRQTLSRLPAKTVKG